jgi:hypothetical protein
MAVSKGLLPAVLMEATMVEKMADLKEIVMVGLMEMMKVESKATETADLMGLKTAEMKALREVATKDPMKVVRRAALKAAMSEILMVSSSVERRVALMVAGMASMMAVLKAEM